MDKGETLLRRITDTLALPGEPLPGITVGELWGRGRLILEHHRGVGAYSREAIQVKTSYGWLLVEGKGLELSLMTRARLIITGEIETISLPGRDGT